MKMIKTKTLFLVCAIGSFLVSCQKEVSLQDLGSQGNNNTNITGDWKFVGLNAKTYTGISISQAGESAKTVTVSDYDTENNAGALKITANQFIFTGISHTVNDEANVKTYFNGVLFDDSDMPFDVTTPPTSNTIDYVRNNNDSLTFTNAMITLPDPSGGTTSAPAGPLGARISIIADTLTVFTKNNSIYETVTQGGIPATIDVKFESTMKFKRQ